MDKPLEEMSYGELISMLAEEARLYRRKDARLRRNGSKQDEFLREFMALTRSYAERTQPIRDELYKRPAR